MTMTAEPTTGTKLRAIVNTDDFRAAVTLAASIIRMRTPKPILLNVKIETTADGIEVSATNLESFVRARSSTVQVESVGVVLANAEKLKDVLREATDDTLTISVEGELLVVCGAYDVFKIDTAKASDYPPIPTVESPDEITVPAKAFADAISRTLIAADTTLDHPSDRTCSYLRISGKKLDVVSTDQRRMAVLPIKIDGGKIDALVPMKTAGLVAASFAELEGDLKIVSDDRIVVFESEGTTIGTTTIEATFPNYNDVIPKEVDISVRASAEDLLKAIRKASIFVDETTKGIRLEFTKRGLRMVSRAGGESEVNFPCKVDGADITIGVNPKFLAQGIAACPTDEVEIGMTAPNRPIRLRGGDWTYVVMPVNLQ